MFQKNGENFAIFCLDGDKGSLIDYVTAIRYAVKRKGVLDIEPQNLEMAKKAAEEKRYYVCIVDLDRQALRLFEELKYLHGE